MTQSGQQGARLHLQYIERDGVERDGSRGQLYDMNGHVQADQFGEALEGEKHQFRFIVAPEDGTHLDLTDYTKRMMQRMESDLGRTLRWAAVNHYNTDNPHVHVVVRGLDHDNQPVRIDPIYISQGMRWRAQDLATAELGLRTEFDVQRQIKREITQERSTSIDRELAQHCRGQLFNLLAYPSDTPRHLPRTVVQGRLTALENLRLAERLSATTWRLVPDWTDRLRALGTRGDIIKTMHRALRSNGDTGRYKILDAKRPLKTPVVGIVRQKGLHDELTDSFYAVVETPRGDAYYVPLRSAATQHLYEGQLVSVESTKNEGKPGIRLHGFAQSPAAQIDYRGPTWLDEQKPDPLAPYGFGAEIHKALQQRQAFLATLKLAELSTAELRKLERRELGERLAATEQQSYVPGLAKGSTFTGQVRLLDTLPSGQCYAQVIDEKRKRFLLLPVSKELREFSQRAVQISRTDDGRLTLKTPTLDRGI